MKFNPRDIPNRAHYDRLMTWCTGVFGRIGPDKLMEIQEELKHDGAEASRGDDDDAKVIAVLAELGFCAVIDNMAEIIEGHIE